MPPKVWGTSIPPGNTSLRLSDSCRKSVSDFQAHLQSIGKSFLWCRKWSLSILGTLHTQCRCGTGLNSSSSKKTARSSDFLFEQDGQKPRHLQETKLIFSYLRINTTPVNERKLYLPQANELFKERINSLPVPDLRTVIINVLENLTVSRWLIVEHLWDLPLSRGKQIP